jgi:hypothetical protein
VQVTATNFNMAESIAGLSDSIFLTAPPDAYKCGLCLKIMKEPKQCPQGHCFCKSCIYHHLSVGQKKCPSCSCALTTASLSNNLIVSNIISDLSVRCATTSDLAKHVTNKCDWKGLVRDIDDHLAEDCQFTVTKCSNLGCGESLERRLMGDHNNVCEFRRVECHYCHIQFPFRTIELHRGRCDLRPIKCACNANFTAAELVKHRSDDCPLTLVDCPMFKNCGKCSGTCDPTGKIARNNLAAHISSPEAMAGNFMTLMLQSAEAKSDIAVVKRDLARVQTESSKNQSDLIRSNLELYIVKLRNNSTDEIRVRQDVALSHTLSDWLGMIDRESDTESAEVMLKQLQINSNVNGKRCVVRHIAVELNFKLLKSKPFPVAIVPAGGENAPAPSVSSSPVVFNRRNDKGQVVLVYYRNESSSIISKFIQFYGEIEPREEYTTCKIHTTMFRFGRGPPEISVHENGCADMLSEADFIQEGFITATDSKVRILATFILDEIGEETTVSTSSSSSSSSSVTASKKRKFY